MKIKRLGVGPLEVNCFIVYDELSSEAMVVDPGGDADMILKTLEKEGLKLKYIICTHGHFDHIGGVAGLKAATGAELLLHKDELELYSAAPSLATYFGISVSSQPAPDRYLAEGDTLKVGSLNFSVMHLPGHSPGGITIYGEGIALTGDTLFAGSIGRTDLPGSDNALMASSLARLAELPDETKVMCGHGPDSTIGHEKRHNPFSHMFKK